MAKIPEQDGVITSPIEPTKNRRRYWYNSTNNKMYILENGQYKLLENEVITNENGTAIKYPDGYMICFLSKSINNLDTLQAYGSLYQQIWRWDYPVKFYENPFVTCGQFIIGTGASWGTVAGANTQYANLRVIDIVPRATGEIVSIRAMAIGRWK